MQPIITKMRLLLTNRFVLFSVFSSVFVVVQYCSFGSWLPSTETKDIWFYSGIFMVLFSMLFIEPYYTSPKNVITNAIPLLLVFLAIKTDFGDQHLWWTTVVVLIVLIITSIIALTIENKNKSPDYRCNKVSNILKDFVVIIGQGKVLYSAVFVYFLLTYYSNQCRPIKT